VADQDLIGGMLVNFAPQRFSLYRMYPGIRAERGSGHRFVAAHERLSLRVVLCK